MSVPQFSGTFVPLVAITQRMMREAPQPSDGDLMRRSAAGDREAFASLYRRHHAMVYRFARLMTGSSAVAEDIVQDVFLVLMREAARYDPARATLSTYLYGIARHRTRRALLRDRRFVALDDEIAEPALAAGDGIAEDLLRRNEIDRMRRAILTLPSRYREVVVLCDLQGLSYADAAATLGCAVGTIRSRLHRARQLLAHKLQRAVTRNEVLRSVARCAV